MKRLIYLLIFLPFFTEAQTITTFANTDTAGTVPLGLTRDRNGNFYVATEIGNNILKITPDGIITVISGISGFYTYSGDGGPAIDAQFGGPVSIAADTTGNLYIADSYNNVIRKIDTAGIITTFAGHSSGGFSGYGYTGDGGPADSASLATPISVAVDATGNIYIADAGNNVIRKVDPAGIISTFAGNGTGGYSGDGAAATDAELYEPWGVAVDDGGNVYISDAGNNVIRKVDVSGTITTFAGSGVGGYSGDGGPATSAQLLNPRWGIAFNSSGSVYIADNGNNVIRIVNSSGIINTFAGRSIGGYSGDGGPANLAQCNSPAQMVLDKAGNVFFADASNNAIRKVSGISGATLICTGDTTIFNANAPGGTWYSSAPSIASVTAAGVVTSHSAGNATIWYVVGTDTAAAALNINNIPDAGTVTGIDTLCLGESTLLSSTIIGGYWTSPSPDITILDNTITGSAGGVDTIYYNLSYTCGIATTPFVVDIIDNNFADVTGPDTICVGDTVTYTEATTGGEWNLEDGSTHATMISPGVIVGDGVGEVYIGYTKSGPGARCSIAHYRTIEIVNCATAGIKSINTNNGNISIFPNPAQTQIVITSSNTIHDITISSSVGQTVYKNTVDQQRVSIDVSSLPSGIYIVRINGTEVKKFVKQ